MIDYSPTLVSELKTIGLPVHYELFLTKDTEVPCISYQEGSNMAREEGDTLWYSEVNYRIKVWSKRQSELVSYSLKIDDLMRRLGFVRVSTNDL